MKFNLTTYKTITGKKQIIEPLKKIKTKAVVYKDEVPTYFVDCYDLQTEANVLMNSLVLCQKQSMKVVIKQLGEKNDVNICVKEAPALSLGSSSKTIELDLPPLPEEWLN